MKYTMKMTALRKRGKAFPLLATAALLAILLNACQRSGPAASPAALATHTPTAIPAATMPGTAPDGAQPEAPAAPTAQPPAPTLPAASTAAPAPTGFDCSADEVTAALLDGLTAESWMGWVRKLSGAEPVTINGEETTITSRFTPAMFPPASRSAPPLPHARAFEYVEEVVRGWYPPEQVEAQEWQAQTRDGFILRGKNLILTIPGAVAPDPSVMLTAHLDSRSTGDVNDPAPGAEDNATGSAALLEAARLLRGHAAERTIRIAWFTGEEQGMLGSAAYVKSLEDPGSVAGVVNLDMFGYDTDGDRCFEIHAGRISASDQVGRCFIQSAEAYGQGLDTFDYLTERATAASDHGSFWNAGIGAVEILENMFDNQQPNGCQGKDHNSDFHTPADTAAKINADTGARIARTALATVIAMAREDGKIGGLEIGRLGNQRLVIRDWGREEGVLTGSAGKNLTAAANLPLSNFPKRKLERGMGGEDLLLSPFSCGYANEIAALIGDLNQEEWVGYLRDLTGDRPVTVGGKEVTITTRYSPALFNGGSAGYDYVREKIYAWFPDAWIEEHEYTPPYPYDEGPRWKNLALTIPGSRSGADLATLLTAHLDSTSSEPGARAPGADDNATGAAALIAAARVLRDRPPGEQFPRALRLVWFTGEEQYMKGSAAYANSHARQGITGVVNVDMIGHDGNGDCCFELHVGALPQSQAIGQCFVDAIDAYDLNLRYEYLVSGASSRSDHGSFWDWEIGAVLALENLFSGYPVGACGPADGSPDYHRVTDTVANLSLDYGFDIARAAIATAFSLASQPAEIHHLPGILNQ